MVDAINQLPQARSSAVRNKVGTAHGARHGSERRGRWVVRLDLQIQLQVKREDDDGCRREYGGSAWRGGIIK